MPPTLLFSLRRCGSPALLATSFCVASVPFVANDAVVCAVEPTLRWDDVEALMTRKSEPQPRMYVSQRVLLNLEKVPPDVPDLVTSAQGVKVRGSEALCICLKRLPYPNRLSDLQDLFGRHSSVLSSPSNRMFDHIGNTFGHLLDDVSKHEWLSLSHLDELSQAIYSKGAAVENCWGFIDGTARPICRPSEDQRQYFSSHKRSHAMKYQAVMCAKGLVCELDDPYPGKRHDGGVLRESDLYEKLETLVQGRDYVIYGDPAYPLRPLLMKPYGGAHLTQAQQLFNTSLSSQIKAVAHRTARELRLSGYFCGVAQASGYLWPLRVVTASVAITSRSREISSDAEKHVLTLPFLFEAMVWFLETLAS
ncbi:hypothetical protein HPB50_011309 [Hyalomma asiaticum]|uniref:Uncharacterized protein n=1 Tax=Hyalomma asiaticum TaxID=266040 RepID=A0ACB7RSF9_HYAAI|nr:hypothetical protein HPB50_011309 [Hyalomma asiaticum]